MEAVSKILEIIQVNSSNKVWKDSTQFKISTSHFQIGDSPRYTNEGQNHVVRLVYINKQ